MSGSIWLNDDQCGGHDEIGAQLAAIQGPLERGESIRDEWLLGAIHRIRAEVKKLRENLDKWFDRARVAEAERDVLAKNLQAIVNVCALAGIGSRGQSVLCIVKDLHAALGQQIERADKLQAFKNFVHSFLDGQGVPHHPPGPHGASGCRIGDRMDWLMDRYNRAISEFNRMLYEKNLSEAEMAHLRAELDRLRRCDSGSLTKTWDLRGGEHGD